MATLQVDTITNTAGTGPVNFSNGFKVSSGIKDIANATYTILDNDGYDLICTDTLLTAGRTVTLPVPANNTGRTIIIKKTDSSTFAVTISVNTGTIDGASSNVLNAQYGQVTLRCDGTNWKILGTSGDYIPANFLTSGPTTGSNTAGSTTSGTVYATAQLSLPPGSWMVYSHTNMGYGTAPTVFDFFAAPGLTSGTIATIDSQLTSTPIHLNTALQLGNIASTLGATPVPRLFQVATTTTVYLNQRIDYSNAGTSLQLLGGMYAIRIG